jgi:hypothetical protein
VSISLLSFRSPRTCQDQVQACLEICTSRLVPSPLFTDSMISVYAMNGKSVEIDSADAEGRLVLSGLRFDFICTARH